MTVSNVNDGDEVIVAKGATSGEHRKVDGLRTIGKDGRRRNFAFGSLDPATPPAPTPEPEPEPPKPPVPATNFATRDPGDRAVGENVEDMPLTNRAGEGYGDWQVIETRFVPPRSGKARLCPLYKWAGIDSCSAYGSGCYAWGHGGKLVETYLACAANGDPGQGISAPTSRSAKAAIDEAHRLWPGMSPVIGFLPSMSSVDVVAGVPMWHRVTNPDGPGGGISVDYVRTSLEAAGPHGQNTWIAGKGRQGMDAREVCRADGIYGALRGGGDARVALMTAGLLYDGDTHPVPLQPVYAYHGSATSRTVTVPPGVSKLVALGAKARGTSGGSVTAKRGGATIASIAHNGDYDEQPVDVGVTPGETLTLSASMSCVQEADDGSLSGVVWPQNLYPLVVSAVGIWGQFK